MLSKDKLNPVCGLGTSPFNKFLFNFQCVASFWSSIKPAEKRGRTMQKRCGKPVKQITSQNRTYQYLCSKIVILLWCDDSLQSFKAIAFMVHRVLILNILRHLFKNKEICTLDRLCVLMIKTVIIHILVTFILLTQGREFCLLIFVAVFLILFNVQF